MLQQRERSDLQPPRRFHPLIIKVLTESPTGRDIVCMCELKESLDANISRVLLQ